MSSRQMIHALFLATGVAIVLLLMTPAVHSCFVVVHGPMTAMRAQRSAWMLDLFLRTAGFLFVGLLAAPMRRMEIFVGSPPSDKHVGPLLLNCAFRC